MGGLRESKLYRCVFVIGSRTNKRIDNGRETAVPTLPLGRGNTKAVGRRKPGLEVIKLLSCSTQLSIKLSLLINMKMPTIAGVSIFISREIFMLSYV